MPVQYIDSVAVFGGSLLQVEKPSRYVGGEAFTKNKEQLAENEKNVFRTLIAFPDLYEIGMGNQAMRIIYNRLNNIDGIVCDRAFAPAPDFEKLLREKNVPLYGLDTGISLAHLDLLMFTLGYELGLNGILTMLDVSGIPLRCDDRNKNFNEYPIVIAGGPAVSNPLPYSPYVDAFWMGEAEAGFFDLADELAQLKKRGKGRASLLKKISCHPNIWVTGKEKAKRAIYSGFSNDENTRPMQAVFPVPSMKIVHNHGTVEIMRGCPNGCRFCHAGFWYRPARQKSIKRIVSEVNDLVKKDGWREISLSSLSSGDYTGVGELVQTLNQLFGGMHVSFQMPSLKVSGFSLSLLEKISVTRKSGLTFAVETPQDLWQMSINKEVTRDSVVEILGEAKKRGWKGAKFYFMLGLPVQKSNMQLGEQLSMNEEEEIVSFITDVGRRARMHFNINVGVFIPKPHTPYQWAAQLDSACAMEKMLFIKSKLKPLGHKVSISDPIISRIEGLLTRGDERAGQLCEEAWRSGSRLDAWDEFINKEKWQQLLDENREMTDSFLTGTEHLPWKGIDSCVTDEYLKQELEKSHNALRTPSCREKCTLCGVCNNKEIKPRSYTEEDKERKVFTSETLCNPAVDKSIHVNQSSKQETGGAIRYKIDPDIYRVLFSFSKQKSAVFHGHLSLIEIFSMSFTRADIPVMFTQGFNPLAKIEIASPLSTGISADCEIAAADFSSLIETDGFIKNLNKSLPQGIRIEKAECFLIPSGMKKHSLTSLLWGFTYANNKQTDYVNAVNEKVYRKTRLDKNCSSLFGLKRTEVLAKNIITGGTTEWASYFDVYGFLYHNK